MNRPQYMGKGRRAHKSLRGCTQLTPQKDAGAAVREGSFCYPDGFRQESSACADSCKGTVWMPPAELPPQVTLTTEKCLWCRKAIGSMSPVIRRALGQTPVEGRSAGLPTVCTRLCAAGLNRAGLSVRAQAAYAPGSNPQSGRL